MTCPKCNGLGYTDGRQAFHAYFTLCFNCGATGVVEEDTTATEVQEEQHD